MKLTQKEVLFGSDDEVYDVKLVNTFISIGKLSITNIVMGNTHTYERNSKWF